MEVVYQVRTSLSTSVENCESVRDVPEIVCNFAIILFSRNLQFLSLPIPGVFFRILPKSSLSTGSPEQCLSEV